MREKLRVFWWKISNSIRNNRILSRVSSKKKVKSSKLTRTFAWIGAAVISISLVGFAAIFLNTENDKESYALTGELVFSFPGNLPAGSPGTSGNNYGYGSTWYVTGTLDGVTVSITITCQAPALYAPGAGTYRIPNFASGGVYTLAVGTQPVSITVTPPGEDDPPPLPQPVAASQAVRSVMKVGESGNNRIQDRVRVFQADADEASDDYGKLISDSTIWTLSSVSVKQHAYGPFTKTWLYGSSGSTSIRRTPKWNGNATYAEQFFGNSSSSTSGGGTTPPAFIDDGITFIGDSIAEGLSNRLTAANNNKNYIRSTDVTKLAYHIDRELPEDQIFYNKIIVAIGTDNPVSDGGVGYDVHLENIVAALRVKNANARIYLTSIYDMNRIDSCEKADPDDPNSFAFICIGYVADFNTGVQMASLSNDVFETIDWFGISTIECAGTPQSSCNPKTGVSAFSNTVIGPVYLNPDKKTPSASGWLRFTSYAQSVLSSEGGSSGGGNTTIKVSGAGRHGYGNGFSKNANPMWKQSKTLTFSGSSVPSTTSGWGPQTATYDSEYWPAGYYTFSSHISNTGEYQLQDWASPFNDDRSSYGGSDTTGKGGSAEITKLEFQPVIKSETSKQYYETSDILVDVLTISASPNSSIGNVDNSNNPKREDTRWWPIYQNKTKIPVEICVTAYGPYQQPQPSNLTAPPTGTIDGSAPDPGGENAGQICKMLTPDSPEVSDNPNIPDRTFKFSRNRNYKSGYYYFYITLGDNTTSDMKDLIINMDWTSHFNPSYENEWAYRKFQPFITSNVYNFDRNDWQPWVDVKESNGINGDGEEIIDRVVARASRTLAGAQNGFQYREAKPQDSDPITEREADGNGEQYWPKYDSTTGNKSGDYLPVLYKFYICGPFQYPQNEGTTPDMKNPTATNDANEYQSNYGPQGTACNGDNALKTIAKYITPNSCSRNPVIKNPDGTWPDPYDNNNPLQKYDYIYDGSVENGRMSTDNTCEINFGRTDAGGTFYQPGYYYFTSEMLKEDQDLYDADSPNPGHDDQVQISSLIESDWHSMFNPLFTQNNWPANTLNEIEWAYVQPQVITKSYMGATTDSRSSAVRAEGGEEIDWTTWLSYRYRTDRTGQFKSLRLDCNEHYDMPTWTDMINVNDFWDRVPPETLTCEHVSDRVYLGFTTTKDVDYAPSAIVKDDNEDEKHWPKTNDLQSGENGENYEVVKYRVKLYGPFSTVGVATDDTLKSDPNEANEPGKTITVVPSTEPAVQGLVNEGSQPAAESCLVAAKYGPNYNDIPEYNVNDPESSWNAYYYQTEKKSIEDKGYYRAEFTRSPDKNCAFDGSGVLGNSDDNNVPYTTLTLKPGVYISVVEVWKVDMNENNHYDNGDTDEGGNDAPDEEDYFSDNGTENGGGANADQQTTNSVHKRGQISFGDVRDLMANDFHSKWADPYETIFVSPDVDVWTLRGNSDNFIVDWGARYHDQYWTIGWSDWKGRYFDVFGNPLPNHSGSDDGTRYLGEENYFAEDNRSEEEVGKLKVTLYGAFDMRPDTAECPADKEIAHWFVDAKDTDKAGDGTRLENMLPSTGDGWYVYVFDYEGDDRVPSIKTKCSDPDEQFHLGEFKPELETQIVLHSNDGKAPTVVSDTVKVTGYAEKDSLVKLTLYRRGGMVHNPNADTLICSVQFRLPERTESATFSVSNYMDKNGYVFVSNTPDGIDVDTNRCFADVSGHYYWYEEFYSPDGEEYMPPRADGPYEWADIEEQLPEVTTNADVSVLVGEPFHDTAIVRLPDGNTKTYNLYMRAYGPTTGVAICDTVGKSNLLFESGPHKVTKSGTYPSAYTTSATSGYVYWIETLVDAETDEVVAEGYCGKALEMTKVHDTASPGEPWEWATPGAPSAGEIAVTAAKIIATTGLLGVGAWQMLDKNSWLLRKIGK